MAQPLQRTSKQLPHQVGWLSLGVAAVNAAVLQDGRWTEQEIRGCRGGHTVDTLLLPLACHFPYAGQRLGHAFPVLCLARVLLSPWSPPFAPPAPQPVARLCSSVSQLLWRI